MWPQSLRSFTIINDETEKLWTCAWQWYEQQLCTCTIHFDSFNRSTDCTDSERVNNGEWAMMNQHTHQIKCTALPHQHQCIAVRTLKFGHGQAIWNHMWVGFWLCLWFMFSHCLPMPTATHSYLHMTEFTTHDSRITSSVIPQAKQRKFKMETKKKKKSKMRNMDVSNGYFAARIPVKWAKINKNFEKIFFLFSFCFSSKHFALQK